MKIYISENKLNLLRESDEEVTFYEFFTEVKNFIKGLLDDPFGSTVGDLLKSHGITRSVLINRLLDRGIITKKEKIDEPYDADGNLKSMHYIQYKVPRKNFEQKMHRLYSQMFEKK